MSRVVGIGKPDEDQKCEDVNECETNNGGCDINSECINTEGGYKCSLCFGWFVGRGEIPCKDGNYCARDNSCSEHADCITTGK